MDNAPMERMLLKILFSHWLKLAELSDLSSEGGGATAGARLAQELKDAIAALEEDEKIG